MCRQTKRHITWHPISQFTHSLFICVCQSLAPGRELCTETVKSGSPASVPDVRAATGRFSVQWQSVSKWPANRSVSGNMIHTCLWFILTITIALWPCVSLMCSSSLTIVVWLLKDCLALVTLWNVLFVFYAIVTEMMAVSFIGYIIVYLILTE